MAFLRNVLDPMGLTTNDDLGTIFVMSGTSVVGHRVATNLLEAGYKDIRVGVWKGNRQLGVDKSIGQTVATELEAKGATVISFDWTKEEQYAMALAGVKSVFCTLPHMASGSPDTFTAFVKACHKAKVDHFVKLSFLRSKGDHDFDPYLDMVSQVKFQRRCDDILTNKSLMDTPMTYTILCASHLMSAPLVYQGPALRKANKYVTASYAMGVDYVSPNDLAKAAVTTLVNRKKHRNVVYNLSGYMITDHNVASWLSKFYGTKIEHEAIGFHEYEAEFKKHGFPDWQVKDFANMERAKATGVDEKGSNYTSDLEGLLGKKPERFKEYLHSKDSMTLQENPAEDPDKASV